MSRVRSWIFFLSACVLGLASSVEAASSSRRYEQTGAELSKAMAIYRSQNRASERYDVVFRRDPMRPLVDSEGRLVNEGGLYNGLAVQGIVHSKDMILALINDEFFHAGDQVGPYKILDIRPDGLKAKRGNETLFIPLYPSSDGQG